MRRIFISSIAVLLAARAPAEEMTAPSPRSIIYPGEIIRSEMLVDGPLDPRDMDVAIRSRSEAVGRSARKTLFPGHPIAAAAIEEPKAVANGGSVRLVYERPGLSIDASGLALQSGREGDAIRVRNVESGLVVTGVVVSAGVVRVDK